MQSLVCLESLYPLSVLQETALDFWRMVVEHNVTTMVRLSGQESQSWQYWPADTGDKTLSFGYMAVTLLNREIVENLDKARSIVPIVHPFLKWLSDVLSSQS